jgi:pimeloyl-ACP methyl ester carboxylesterase
MVERFNGRIEAVLQGKHIRPGEDLEATPHRYAWLTNQQRPQSALGSKSPLQAMSGCHKPKPQLFRKQPHYLAGRYTEFDLPIYIFVGRHDRTAHPNLSRAYFDAREAPVKGCDIFENSAHSPLFEEPARATEILLNDVLPGVP